MLKDIELTVEAGECVVITGPSGCGKTTLTRMINGLIPHVYDGELQGSAIVEGRDVTTWNTEDMGIIVGSVFQNPRSQFVSNDTTSEIAFGCENIGLPRSEIIARMERAVCALSIEKLLHREIHELSGGQKQAVILASAYSMMPNVFVLDEPTASLDIPSMRRLARAIADLKSMGKTIVVSEHRLWWLRGIADRVVAMRDGSIVSQWQAGEFEAVSLEEKHTFGFRAWSESELLLSERDIGGAQASCAQAEDPFLSAKGLDVAYRRGQNVLQGLNIQLNPGSILGLVGENGAGKTTLLRCLCGLEREKCGDVVVNGRNVRASERSHYAHMVMQDPGYQMFAESVGSELSKAMNRDDMEDDGVEELLGQFGLAHLADRHPLSLSGGEQQRLSIAVGIAREVQVILLDEPTSGLDFENMRRVALALRQAADRGCAVCIVTHDYEFLLKACDEIAVLEEGKVKDRYPLDDSARVAVAKRFGFQEPGSQEE